MARLPSPAVEQLADTILDRNDALTVPVPVGQILTADDVTVARNHAEGVDVAGFFYLDGSRRIIGVNTATSPRRQRFAMAHCFGHLQIHPESTLIACHSVWVEDRVGGTSVASAEQETAANWFAGALLMPRRLIVPELAARVEAGDFASRDELIGRMARAFEVSVEAMGWRLMSLNLIGG
jgi:Zn-dependent peptidase ImmA (M78 family)